MTIFTISKDNNVSTFASEEEAANYPEIEHFRSAEELTQLAAYWPAARLVEIWNTLPGSTQVKKFTDRATAVTRIWRAIQPLAEPVTSEPVSAEGVAAFQLEGEDAAAGAVEPEVPTGESGQEADVAPHAADVASSDTTSNEEPTLAGRPPKAPREGSKGAIVLELLKREGGATLQELMSATGWQKHSIRGFLSGTIGKKMGLTVLSAKSEAGERTYSMHA